MAVALLFISSPWSPNPQNTLAVCCGYHSSSRGGGLGGKRLHSQMATNPLMENYYPHGVPCEFRCHFRQGARLGGFTSVNIEKY